MSLQHFLNRLPLNDTLLLIISANTIIIVAEIRALHVSQELLVVRDDYELKVRLCLARLDNAVQRLGKTADIVLVQVRRWLVEGDEL